MVKGTVCKTVVRWFDSNYGLKIHGGCSSVVEHRFVVPSVAGSNPVNHPNTEGVRMDEDTALKAAGCKRLGGSIPSSSAKNGSLAQWIRAFRYGREDVGVRIPQESQLRKCGVMVA